MCKLPYNNWLFFIVHSVLLVTKGDLADLAGVYTFSFLTVMALFGVPIYILSLWKLKESSDQI